MNKPITNFKELREKAGLTQLEISLILGVTENTYANWEKGRSGVQWITNVIKLCKLFNCKPEDLITHVEENDEIQFKALASAIAKINKFKEKQ